MRALVSRLLLTGLAATMGLALPACGDDDGDGVDVGAMDFEGWWRFDAVRVFVANPFVCDGEASCEIRVTADTTPFSLLGDVDVVAVGDTAMELRGRNLFLLDGLPTDVPEPLTADVALEPAARRWVIVDQDGEAVYRFEREGDALTLTYDVGDPRNDPVEDGTFLEIDVVRAVRPQGWSVGAWRVAEVVFDGETFEAGVCQQVDAGLWGIEEILFDIDERFLTSQRFVRQAYLDEGCNMPTGPTEMESLVGAAVEGADTLELYETDEDGDDAGYFAFDAGPITADALELERTACRPEEGGCLEDSPERVRLERVSAPD